MLAPEDPTSTFQGLEAIPSVSFDIGLGKLVDYIDFDYAAYNRHLEERGLSEGAISETSVRIESVDTAERVRRIMGLGRHGAYGRGQVRIKIGKSVDEDKANLLLRHETQHRVDDVNGTITTAGEIGNFMSNATGSLSMLTLNAGAVYWEATNPGELPTDMSSPALKMMAIGLGGIALSRFYYYASSSERRARGPQTASSEESFLSFKPKSAATSTSKNGGLLTWAVNRKIRSMTTT